MKRLLLTEIKKHIFSPLSGIAILIIFSINAFEILATNYGYQTSATSFLFTHTTILCIILSVLIPLHVGQEFEYRTVDNKIAIGYQRIHFYLAESISSIILVSIMLLFDSVIIIVFCNIRHYKPNNNVSFLSILVNFMITLFSLCTIISLYTAIIMIVRQRIISIIITLLLSLGLVQIGNLSVSALNQPKYRSYEESDSKETTLVQNPLYISGTNRTINNFHVCVSPFAQINYIQFTLSDNSDKKRENSFFMRNCIYHFEYCISDLIEIICFFSAGFYFFKHANLK